MKENIQSTFVRVNKNPVMLIKGKTGFTISIVKCIVINKTTKSNTINVFILDSGKKHYLERNLVIVPKTKMELFTNKSITLNRQDRIYIESVRKVDMDVICDYVEKIISFDQINLIFTDQHGNNVDDINYEIEKSTFELNRKLIRFEENDDFLVLEPIEFEVNGNEITVFKTNDIDVISEYGCIDLEDRFIVKIYKTRYSSIDEVDEKSFIRVNIAQENELWKFDSDEEWRNPGEIYTILPGEHTIEFEEFGGETPENFTFTALRNNLYDLTFDLEDPIEDPKTILKINKSDFISDEDAIGIRWRVIGTTETLNYEDQVEDLAPEEYEIEIQKFEEYFETIKDKVQIIQDQTTIYQINNELVRRTTPSIDFILPSTVSIAINVIRKPILSVIFEPKEVEHSKWRLIYPSGVTTPWKSHNTEMRVGIERYQIEFGEINDYLKPSMYDLIIPLKTLRKKIKAVYTLLQKSQLTINFILPNKYSQYLSWCLMRPDEEDIFYIFWNNEKIFNENIPHGRYLLKVKEVLIGDTLELPLYDYQSGVEIPNRILISGYEKNIVLEENLILNEYLIFPMELPT